MKTAILSDKNEIRRKRDILASIAMLEGLESYVGEKITAVQIRKMKEEKLESYFNLYQEKATQKTTNEMMLSLIEISIKGISYVVNLKNEEELKNDLLNNKQLRRAIGRRISGTVENYGDVVSYMKGAFDVFKQISFSSQEVLAEPAEKEEVLAEK